MYQYLVVSVLLFCCASIVWAADVPGYAQELGKFTGAGSIGEQSMRMRITVASNVAQAERSVRSGDLLLCSSVQCYRARTPGYVDIVNTAEGKANVLADVSIPVTTVTDVYFTEVSGRSIIKGHLKLETPLVIDTGFSGVELMVGVQKQNAGTQTTYIPVQSSAVFFTDDSELVHYLPSMPTVADLSLGTKFSIPAGALDRPQIFNIGIAKVGEIFPKIDIFPYIDLKKAATIEVRAVRKTSTTHELIVPIMPTEGHDDALMLEEPAARPSAKLVFYRTRVIEPSILERSN